jgi:hypothetical protein
VLENCVCLSHGVQVAGAAWWAATRIVEGVGDLVQRTGDGHTSRVVGGRTIRRSGDVVCGLHRARRYEERGFLGLASKPLGQFISSLASKPQERFSLVWPQNRWQRFSPVWSQN